MALVALRNRSTGGHRRLLCIRRQGSTLVVCRWILVPTLALRVVFIMVVNGLKQHSWNGPALLLNVLIVLSTLAGGK